MKVEDKVQEPTMQEIEEARRAFDMLAASIKRLEERGGLRYRIDRFLWCAPVISRVTWFLWKVRTVVQYWLTGDCGNNCGWEEPYGWVAEAGCPVHDR